MINRNLPEPPIEDRYCHNCGRDGKGASLKGQLLHWPHENYTEETVRFRSIEVSPFSWWFYVCRWCRGAYTRQRKKQGE